MNIYVNSRERTVPEGYSLEELLKEMGLNNRTAAWINGEQILRNDYSSRILNHLDHIKIIRPLAGG